MRLALIIGLLSIFILGYQNCGSGITGDPGFFVSDQSGSGVSSFGLDSCYGESGCTEDPYMMWLKIRESNPYYVPPGSSHFTVAGSCGVGNFKKHMIQYTIQESADSQRIVGRTTASEGDDRCSLGLFSIPIELNEAPADYNSTGKRYEVTVEIFGLGEGFQPIANPAGVSRSRIEVIFANPASSN